jgi:hypothetical protein
VGEHTESGASPDPKGGTFRGWFLGCSIVFALSSGIFWLLTQFIRQPPTWLTFEFCQYAEIGRNLALDGTFDTRLVEPMALAAIDHSQVGPPSGRWPVVNRYPLPCLVVAGLMRVLGPTDVAAAWSNGLAIGLLAATTYAAARKWFGAGWAAVVALLFLADPSICGEFLLLGTPDVWFASIFLLELLVWSSFDPSEARPRLAWAVVLGVLGGLAYLSRFNALVFVALQALALARYRRWRELGVMTLAAAVVVSPMLAYNMHHFRRPFVSIYSAWNLLDRIGAYRVEPWLYYQRPDIPRVLMVHASGFFWKFVTCLFVFTPMGIWCLWRLDVLMPAALVGPWFARRASGFRRFACWSIGLFALQLVLFSALRLEFLDRDSPFHGRYFFWFAAPAILIGVGTLNRISSWRRWARWVVGVAILAQLGLFVAAWVPNVRWHLSTSRSLARDPLYPLLARIVKDNRVIGTNAPQITAWFSGLRSVSLPADPNELARLNRDSPTPIDYICVDNKYSAIDLDPRWRLLIADDPRIVSPFEPALLRDYEYALPPGATRENGFVVLRRKGVPMSGPERESLP